MNILTLARHNPRTLGFGFLHALASSAGQTFVIALFLPGMKTSLGLGDAEVAGFYAVATVAGAAVLWAAGRWIDRVDLVRYSLVSGLFLALACLLTATTTWAPLLALGFFGLRLGGQGLLTHVAVTSVARHFSTDRGKALSLTLLGHPFGEAALPIIVVMLIGAWGWRPVMAAAGGLALALVLAACALVRGNAEFRKPHTQATPIAPPAAHGPPAAKPRRRPDSRYIVLNGPLFIATSLIFTALVFHQAVIAQQKGFPLEWFALSFTAYAVAKVASAVLMGPLIDRIGASRLFTFHILPSCAGIALLAAGHSGWVVPAYWVLAGVTSGMAGTLQAAIVAEHVAPERLGTVRGIVAAVSIVASAVGPVLYAWVMAAGLTATGLLWVTVAAMLMATLMSASAGWRGR